MRESAAVDQDEADTGRIVRGGAISTRSSRAGLCVPRPPGSSDGEAHRPWRSDGLRALWPPPPGLYAIRGTEQRVRIRSSTLDRIPLEGYMRFLKTFLASAGLLVATVGTATAMVLQDPVLEVEVETNPSRTVWYTDPVWLAIGGIVALIIIVLAVMAARGKGNDTTVVR